MAETLCLLSLPIQPSLSLLWSCLPLLSSPVSLSTCDLEGGDSLWISLLFVYSPLSLSISSPLLCIFSLLIMNLLYVCGIGLQPFYPHTAHTFCLYTLCFALYGHTFLYLVVLSLACHPKGPLHAFTTFLPILGVGTHLPLENTPWPSPHSPTPLGTPLETLPTDTLHAFDNLWD